MEGSAISGVDEGCRVNVGSFSCQEKNFEQPDADTEKHLREHAASALKDKGCDPDAMSITFQTTLVGKDKPDYSGEKLVSLGMASNCYAQGNDPNGLTHKINAVCTNQYDFRDNKGQMVRDTNKKFFSQLSTCDISEEAMPQLMEDARKVAVYNAKTNGYGIQRNMDLACTFSVMPQV